MKIAMILGVIGMLLPAISHGQSLEETEPQKVYVQPTELAIADREIFAFIAGQWVSVNAIYCDAVGLYVEPSSKNPYHSRWWCKECGYSNNGYDKTCQRELPNGQLCGNPRPW